MTGDRRNPHESDLYTREAKGIGARALARATITELCKIQGRVDRVIADAPIMRQAVGMPLDQPSEFSDAMKLAAKSLERAYLSLSESLNNQVMALRSAEDFTSLGREGPDPFSSGD